MEGEYKWVALKLIYLFEIFAFYCERLITINLTYSWLNGCYYFLVNSQKYDIFRSAALWARHILVYTNMIYSVSYLSGHILAKAFPSRPTYDQLTMRKKWHDVELLAFWNERLGMLLVVIYGYVCHRYSYATGIVICFLPCMILFPFANILYFLWFFIFGEGKKTLEWIKRAIEKDAIDHVESPKLNRMEKSDDNSSTTNCKDEVQQAEVRLDDEASKGMVTVRIYDVDPLDEGLPDLEEVQESERKEVNNEFGQQADKLAAGEEEYKKELEKVEKKWARKLKNEQKKYREECKNWKERENNLLDKISNASSQALEGEEKLGKLEKEKNELITKLSAANVSCELYRSLLHDPCTPNLTFSFSSGSEGQFR